MSRKLDALIHVHVFGRSRDDMCKCGDAGCVVEKMVERMQLVKACPLKDDAETQWRFVVWVDGNRISVIEDTFPLTACLAALRAVGVTAEEIEAASKEDAR